MDPQLVQDTAISTRARARRWEYDGTAARAYAGTAHGGFEIAFVETGTLAYRIGAERMHASAGSLVLVPAGIEHATEFGVGLRGGALHVTDAVVDMLHDVDAFVPDHALLVADARAHQIGQLILAETRDGDVACADALLDALARKLFPLAPQRASVRDPRLARAVDLIHARSSDDIGVDDIARAAGMSRFHMSRLFHDAHGKSPYRFLLDVRLDDAARRLARGASVTDAALSAGFADLSRFARMFKARFGASPRNYSSAALRSASSIAPSALMS